MDPPLARHSGGFYKEQMPFGAAVKSAAATDRRGPGHGLVSLGRNPGRLVVPSNFLNQANRLG
jgi:hypothetical protein